MFFAILLIACDEEGIAIKNQIVMLLDSWSNVIYVCLIYVSMYDEASEQRNLSVNEAIFDRAKQLSTVPSYHVTQLSTVPSYHVTHPPSFEKAEQSS